MINYTHLLKLTLISIFGCEIKLYPMYSMYISDLRNLDEWMDGWINGIRRTNPMNFHFHFHFHFPFRRFREFPNIHHRSIINQSINQSIKRGTLLVVQHELNILSTAMTLKK